MSLVLFTQSFSQQLEISQRENVTSHIYVAGTERYMNTEMGGLDFIKRIVNLVQRGRLHNSYQGFIMDGVVNDTLIEINLYLKAINVYANQQMFHQNRDELLYEHSQIFSAVMLQTFQSIAGFYAMRLYCEENPEALEILARVNDQTPEEWTNTVLNEIPRMVFKFGFVDQNYYILGEYDVFRYNLYSHPQRGLRNEVAKLVQTYKNR